MAFPRPDDQMVKFIGNLLRLSHLMGQSFSLCPPDLSLNGILVKSAKNLLQARTQIEDVPAVIAAFSQASALV
jgi:hypothetical protein